MEVEKIEEDQKNKKSWDGQRWRQTLVEKDAEQEEKEVARWERGKKNKDKVRGG